VFKAVISHFGSLDDATIAKKINAAVDEAYTDDILFEDFEVWVEERNDKALLYQIEHFLKHKEKKPIKNADITGNHTAIEKIQKESERDIAQIFASKLQALANQKGLKTNKEIGEFLGKNQEQVRVLLTAEHKPQRKTLLLVSEKFNVTVESLIGM
jgi:hypothetical protein